MLMIEEFAAAGECPQKSITLPFEMRQKSRLRARIDGGPDVGILLGRGRVLRSGDLLKARDGTVIEVRAAPEAVSTLRCADPLTLTRGAYHLGNRHVPLQIGSDFLRYQSDYVLDDLAKRLGFEVITETAPFEPEAGAYDADGHGSHGHGGHGHGHHGHDHHDHDHHEHHHSTAK